jgi:hypothetical protein
MADSLVDSCVMDNIYFEFNIILVFIPVSAKGDFPTRYKYLQLILRNLTVVRVCVTP